MTGTTVAASPPDISTGRDAWLTAFFRDFREVSPGRVNVVIRTVVATSIVLLISMTLAVPSVALSLFVVMSLSMLPSTKDAFFVAFTGLVAILVATVAIAVTIVAARFTIDHPLPRLLVMALVLFLGMFVQRTLTLGAGGFLVAYIFVLGQSEVDLFSGGEQAVRGFLWVWAAVAYPAAVTIGVNLLLLPADPEPLLRQGGAARLRAVARAIGRPEQGVDAQSAATALAAFAAQGMAPLQKLVRDAQMFDASVTGLRGERMAKILVVQRLVQAGALFAELAVEPSADERLRLERVAAACERYAVGMLRGDLASVAPLPAIAEAEDSSSAIAAVITELEQAIRELPVADRFDGGEPVRGSRLVVPDAFANPRYAQFALKVTLAAMFCYVTYTAIDWNGIHTCMATCVIVALGSAEATIHKATLRLAGCAIGGGLALASIVFVVPQMTSIGPLLLLVAAVTAVAAWIARGSARFAYLGMQLSFTFYLAVLHGFGPSTNLTEFRDRLFGVVFGVVVMAVVFKYVWPERAGPGLVRLLAAALRRMSALSQQPADATAQESAAWQSLVGARELAGFVSTEASAREARALVLIQPARRVLLTQVMLERVRSTRREGKVAVDGPADAALRMALAQALESVAIGLESGRLADHVDLRTPLSSFSLVARSSGAETELALWSELVVQVELLERAV